MKWFKGKMFEDKEAAQREIELEADRIAYGELAVKLMRAHHMAFEDEPFAGQAEEQHWIDVAKVAKAWFDKNKDRDA